MSLPLEVIVLRCQRCGLFSPLLCCAKGPVGELALCSACVAHAGGNIRLVAGMAEGLPIIYNSVVQEVEYSDSKVRVSTASTSYEGESAALLELGSTRALLCPAHNGVPSLDQI